MMGKLASNFDRFPLLLKFLDCREVLSVQVHPSDDHKELLPAGESGKTEAWVVLETAKDSRIYAGLKTGTTAASLNEAVRDHKVAEKLSSFIPKPGDGIFIPSGTVHSLCGAIVFEVQENSDVTYRLYDWERTDPKTGKPRELQVDQALACTDFNQVNIGPVKPKSDPQYPAIKEQLFNNEHFALWRIKSDTVFEVGETNKPNVLVCTSGRGELACNGVNYHLRKGEVMLLPAHAGLCIFSPAAEVTLLEIRIPDAKKV